MKTFKSILLVFFGLIAITSCRTEDDLIIDPSVEATIQANSTIANLMSRAATKDGSQDNIIDAASCLSVQLPVTVTVNGTQLTITDDDGYEEIEDIIDLFDDDVDSVIITYPITVILTDYSTVIVNSDSELATLAASCPGENDDDDDIECIDFQYPITASVFNASNDLISTITITNDNEMYDFIDDLDDFAVVTITLPITVTFSDGTTQVINSIQELEFAIEFADDTCDEDDDNDFNDDDCDNCTTTELEILFGDCNEWKIDDFERNDTDLENQYSAYTFSFQANGTVTATAAGTTQTGTWSLSGTGNDIIMDITIAGLPDFNAVWNLSEIEQDTDEVSFELYIGDDELSFFSTCDLGSNSGDNLSDTLTATGSMWIISSFIDEGVDETSDFTGYEFTFETTGVVTAQNGSMNNTGTWSSLNNATELLLDFGSIAPLEELDEDWDVVSISTNQIQLQYIDNGVLSTLVIDRI